MTVLLSSPPLGEEGVSLCVVPPQSLDPPLQNVVQVGIQGLRPWHSKGTKEYITYTDMNKTPNSHNKMTT